MPSQYAQDIAKIREDVAASLAVLQTHSEMLAEVRKHVREINGNVRELAVWREEHEKQHDRERRRIERNEDWRRNLVMRIFTTLLPIILSGLAAGLVLSAKAAGAF